MSYQNFQIHPAVFTSIDAIDKRIHLSKWQQASESLQNLGVTWYGLMVTQTNCQKITSKVAVFLNHPIPKKSRKKNWDQESAFRPCVSWVSWLTSELEWKWLVMTCVSKACQKRRVKRISTPCPCHHCQPWSIWKDPKSLIPYTFFTWQFYAMKKKHYERHM